MMLEHMGWGEAAALIDQALARVFLMQGRARALTNGKSGAVETTTFGRYVNSCIQNPHEF